MTLTLAVYFRTMPRMVTSLFCALIWALILPFVGYAAFCVMLIFPVFGLFMGSKLVLFIYQAGFVPALLTALFFEFYARHLGFLKSFAVTCLAGFVSSALWIIVNFAWWGQDGLKDSSLWLVTIFGICGGVAAVLMPVFAGRRTPAILHIES
ncbi:MAG: hypothetical protein AAFY19_03600 [Pseudomonadota bacterium]